MCHIWNDSSLNLGLIIFSETANMKSNNLKSLNMNLLHIDSSILGPNSVSRKLTADIVAKLKLQKPYLTVTYRDLTAEPIPHLSGAYLTASRNAQAVNEPAIQEDIDIGGSVMQEFLSADTVVIGVSFYNFSIPTQLKSWIDGIVIAGQTFKYGANDQPEGLVGGKRVIMVVARGSFYGHDTLVATREHAESYMRDTLGFLGITNLEVIVAEGLAVSSENLAAALTSAVERIAELTA
jgi:FMN-dependent NADH-azoreductase